jgi:hypothetical protein
MACSPGRRTGRLITDVRDLREELLSPRGCPSREGDQFSDPRGRKRGKPAQGWFSGRAEAGRIGSELVFRAGGSGRIGSELVFRVGAEKQL